VTDIAAELRALGQDSTAAALRVTAGLYESLHEHEPYAGIRAVRDVAYGPHPRNRLDLFTSDVPAGAPRPVFVFAHAGGFVEGDKHEGGWYWDNVGLWAARNGFAGVTMNYRFAPGSSWPSGREDVAGVVAWIAANIANHHGNPAQIVLMGHSAGSTHVADYIADRPAPNVVAAILASGTYDPARVMEIARSLADPALIARYRERLGGYFGSDEARYAELSANPGLARTSVPLLIACAEYDPTIFQDAAGSLIAAIVAQQQHMPASICSPGHTHYSEILQLNAGPNYFSDLLLSFMRPVLS
jgi:acetyl esterase/lipase